MNTNDQPLKCTTNTVIKDTKAPRYIKPDSVKFLEALSFETTKNRFPNFPFPPKPSYRDDTSNGLTKCVIDLINLKGFQAERINSTGMLKDNRKTSTDILGNKRIIGSVQWIKSTSQKGTADISATIKGRSVKIEIKCYATGDKYQSSGQIAYQKQIERSGGVYLIVRNFTDFYNWFQNIQL